MQRTAQCNTLQHTATHCTTLQHIATHCNTLQHTARLCKTLQQTATHGNTMSHTHQCLASHIQVSHVYQHTRLALLALVVVVTVCFVVLLFCSFAVLLFCCFAVLLVGIFWVRVCFRVCASRSSYVRVRSYVRVCQCGCFSVWVFVCATQNTSNKMKMKIPPHRNKNIINKPQKGPSQTATHL